MKTNRYGERGVASILTVIFFILIVSVITLGFMRMSLLEGEQTLEDSLSKSALAAAYSGVNDAKRALLYCLNNTTDTACNESSLTGINNQNCRGFFENVNLQNALNVYPSAQHGGVPVGDPAGNERYTCVVISNDTYDVSGPLNVDQQQGTDIIPLRGIAPFTKVRISWQQSGPAIQLGAPTPLTYNGQPESANYRDTTGAAGFPSWNTAAWPALLRMSLFAHNEGNITYDAAGNVNITEKTAFLYPKNSGISGDVQLASLNPRQSVLCRSGAAGYDVNPNSGTGKYSCQLTLTSLPAAVMYLQLTTMYKDTDYMIELLDASNNAVKFDDVSPMIDSTGAVENVFRRVQVRLRYQGDTPILPNALDVGTGICKNFSVSPSGFSENCGY